MVIKKVKQYNLADIMSNNGFELKKAIKENTNKDLVIIIILILLNNIFFYIE